MVYADEVESSWISSVEYDTEKKSLTVYFIRGGSYTYEDVNEGLYHAMMLPGMSKGKFVNIVLKPMDI